MKGQKKYMTASTKYKKPQYKTEKVILDSGEKVDICRTALANLELLLEIQDRLLAAYVECDGSMYKLMTNPEIISDLTTICSLLPIVGKSETLSFEAIQDNWEQLVVLFFNSGYDIDSRQTNTVLPSKVSQLHFLPYMEMLQKHLDNVKESKSNDS